MGNLLLGLAFLAQLCGDCDGDGKVAIAELVRAVSNALAPDECAECTRNDCGGGLCLEFPEADGIACDVAICFQSEAQIARCVHRFHDTTDRCFEASP